MKFFLLFLFLSIYSFNYSSEISPQSETELIDKQDKLAHTEFVRIILCKQKLRIFFEEQNLYLTEASLDQLSKKLFTLTEKEWSNFVESFFVYMQERHTEKKLITYDQIKEFIDHILFLGFIQILTNNMQERLNRPLIFNEDAKKTSE